MKNADQAYLAGFAEGFLSAELILLHLKNIKYDMYNDINAPWGADFAAVAT